MAYDFDLWPAKTQVAPASSTKYGAIHIPVNCALPVGALVLNKVTRLVRVPKGFVFTGASLTIPILDSNGSPTLTWSLGDPTTAARYIANSTKGRTSAGTITISDLVVAGLLFANTANTDILFTCTAASATAVAGSIIGTISGYVK